MSDKDKPVSPKISNLWSNNPQGTYKKKQFGKSGQNHLLAKDYWTW